MSTQLPLVSIIVPNYNHERYLEQRLNSVLNQTYPNFEVILLDDCSTDNSKVILNRYASHPKVSYSLFNDDNSGNTFLQWKKGIALSKGDFIWIAESDDFCDPCFINEVIKPLLNNKDIVMSYCQSNKVDDKGKKIGNWITFTEIFESDIFSKNGIINGNYFIEKFLIFKNVIPNASAVIFRKSSFKNEFLEINRYSRYCGDWIFYFKILLNNKIAFISHSYNNFRYHSDSVIANAVKNENGIHIVDIEFAARKSQIDFLNKNRPKNYLNITSNNNMIVRNLKYKKAILLLKNKQIIQGFFLLITVLDKFNFNDFFKVKLKRVFSVKKNS